MFLIRCSKKVLFFFFELTDLKKRERELIRTPDIFIAFVKLIFLKKIDEVVLFNHCFVCVYFTFIKLKFTLMTDKT